MLGDRVGQEEWDAAMSNKADAKALQNLQRSVAELKDLMDARIKHAFAGLLSKYMAGAPQLSEDGEFSFGGDIDEKLKNKADQSIVDELQQQVNELMNKFGGRKSSVTGNLTGNEDVGELLNAMKLMENRMEELSNGVRDSKEREEMFLERWNDLKALCDELQKENNTLRDQNRNLTKRLEKIENNISGVSDDVSKRLKDALDALQANDEFQDKTDAKLSNLQRELNNQRKYQKDQFESIDNRLSELKNAVKQLEENENTLVKQCNDEFGNIRNEVGDLQSQINDLKDPLETEICNLKNECNTLIEELQRQQAQHRQTLNDYIAILEEKKQTTISDYQNTNTKSRALLTKKELSQSPAVLVENLRLKQDNMILRANIKNNKKSTLLSDNDDLYYTKSSYATIATPTSVMSNNSSRRGSTAPPSDSKKYYIYIFIYLIELQLNFLILL